jgi:glycerol-3-phosphate dehydrogenase
VSRLGALQGEHFDVVVIGGGIIGCGIARDAALRGLRVALFEKRDFGSGTTAASTRIVHGGLRYLEMLDFRLVRLDLRERETLLKIAPHLVKPLEFVIPFFAGDWTRAASLRAGLAAYDALSFDKTLPSRRWLSAADAAALEPVLGRAGVRRAAAYYDARADAPERLALENVIHARERGAAAFNYCDVVGLQVANGRLHGVRVRDAIDGTEAEAAARVVINATGAWYEPVASALTGREPGAIRTTKGVHIVVDNPLHHALVLYSQVDRRLLFAIPRHGLTWIGTTDTDFDGDPADARATRADVDYLIASVRHVFPSLSASDVLYTTAGVRALVRQRGSESSVSRMHKIVERGPDGLVSVLGGKITGYRAIAEQATDVACHRLGLADRRSVTAEAPLPGAMSWTEPAPTETAARHCYGLYGSRAAEVLALARASPELGRPLSPRHADIGAQVVFGVRHEHCLMLPDFMKRRTLLGVAPDQGWDAAAPAAALMARELGWSAAERAQQLAAYRSEIDAARTFDR